MAEYYWSSLGNFSNNSQYVSFLYIIHWSIQVIYSILWENRGRFFESIIYWIICFKWNSLDWPNFLNTLKKYGENISPFISEKSTYTCLRYFLSFLFARGTWQSHYHNCIHSSSLQEKLNILNFDCFWVLIKKNTSNLAKLQQNQQNYMSHNRFTTSEIYVLWQ